MIKYYNTMVVFEEIPDEITLAINITNCPCRCPSCHSKFLWEDTGDVLDEKAIDKMLSNENGITCICFMGGDSEPEEVNRLSSYVRSLNNGIKIAWYSGRDELSDKIEKKNFDYIKIGRYDDDCGSLDKKTTNQRLYDVNDGFKDITYKFQTVRETGKEAKPISV